MLGIMPGEHDWMGKIGFGLPSQRTPGFGGLLGGGIFSSPQISGGVMGDDQSAAKRDAMMAAAAQLLQGSGYSPVRRSFGEIVGQAMMAGQNARAQSLAQAQDRRLKDAQIGTLERKEAQSPFGTVDPDQFTPESLAKFQQSGNYADLVPKSGGADTADMQNYKFWQSLSPEQQKQFMALQRQPTAPQLAIINGAPHLVDRLTGSMTPLSTTESEAKAAGTIKGAEAEGAATGKARGEVTGGIITKGANATSVVGMLDIAEPLIDAATGSLTGATRDKLAAVFGEAPEGAQAIAQLKVIQAALIQSMPRLEGPQSDADRKLYVEAAGQIGDDRAPAPVKRAALQTVRQIQQKYMERASSVTGNSVQQPTQKRRYNPQTGKIE